MSLTIYLMQQKRELLNWNILRKKHPDRIIENKKIRGKKTENYCKNHATETQKFQIERNIHIQW